MISVIMPYFSHQMVKELENIDGEKEIFIPANTSIKEGGFKRINAETTEEFIIRSMKECRGEKILFLGGITDGSTLAKILNEDADIVYLSRKTHSTIARFFIHLLFPFSRKFTDPLTQIFAIKRDVIEGVEIKPIEKIFMEIIAKGKYGNIKEIKSDANINFRKEYRKYSKYILTLAWKHGELMRFIKFGIVGLSSSFFNEFLLWLTVPLGIIFAGIIAIEGGTMFAFLGNDLWTFRDRRKRGIKNFLYRMMKYHLFSFFALIINMVILVILVKFLSFEPLTANIIGMASAFTWNFLTNNFIVWPI